MKEKMGRLRSAWYFVWILWMITTNSQGAELETLNLTLDVSVNSGKARTSSATSLQQTLPQKLQMSEDERLIKIVSRVDSKGWQHTRYQQMYKDLPIWGQHIIVHDRGNKSAKITGRIARNLSQDLSRYLRVFPSASTSASVDVEKVAERWVRAKYLQTLMSQPVNEWQVTFRDTERSIFVKPDNLAVVVQRLTLLVTAPRTTPKIFNVLVDEQSGVILKAWDGISRAQATGPGGNEKTGSYYFGVDYGSLTVTETEAGCALQNERVITIDMEDTFDPQDKEVFQFPCYENIQRAINGAYSPLNDVHYFGDATVRMYSEWAGIEMFPQPIRLNVHYGFNEADAFWDGSSANFGNGNDEFYPFTDNNIVAHEISHGFTERNSNLIYSDQSGGINEAFSDIAGEALELFVNGNVDWLIGTAIIKNKQALRYFNDPTQDGLSIKDARDYFDGMNVHYSSGVYNQAFYTLATAPGWGVKQGFLTFLHANQNYWTPSTTFSDGACGVIEAARDLGYAHQQVVISFAQVGVVCPSDTTDTDNDGMPDGWEIIWGFDYASAADAGQDPDQDQLSNIDEYLNGSSPNQPDTDFDGLLDGAEVNQYGTNPLSADSDQDVMTDGFEVEYELDPLAADDAAMDADNDGFSNLQEFELRSNPRDANSKPVVYEAFIESFESDVPADLRLYGDAKTTPLWQISDVWFSNGSLSLSVGPIGDGESSTAELKRIVTFGEISFDYQVSTETGYDFLEFRVDGVVVEEFSGAKQGSYSHILEAGVHSLQFVYRKDASEADNEDRVWIDNIRFQAINKDLDDDGMPNGWEDQYGLDPQDPADAELDLDSDGLSNRQEYEMNTDPGNNDSDADGLTDGVEVNDLGTSATSEDTDLDGLPDGFEFYNDLDPKDPGDASLDADKDGVTNDAEYQMGTDPRDAQSFPVLQKYFLESFEQGLPSDWFNTGADVSWVESGLWFSDGALSLMAAGLDDGQAAAVEFKRFYPLGSLSFGYKVSTEAEYDFFRVYLDNELVLEQSGVIESTFELSLSSGVHVIKLLYVKDRSDSANDDAVWVDRFEFVPEGPDVDGDGMPSEWELANGLDPYSSEDAELDQDQDGYSNLEEFMQGTDPNEANIDLSLRFLKVMEINLFKIYYEVILSNEGIVDAHDVTLVHELPVRLLGSLKIVIDPDSGVQCEKTETQAVCSLKNLPANDHVVIAFVASPRNSLQLYNFSGEVTAQQADANPADNKLAAIYAGSLQWLTCVMLLGLFGWRRIAPG